jgi:hypothetical protein
MKYPPPTTDRTAPSSAALPVKRRKTPRIPRQLATSSRTDRAIIAATMAATRGGNDDGRRERGERPLPP